MMECVEDGKFHAPPRYFQLFSEEKSCIRLSVACWYVTFEGGSLQLFPEVIEVLEKIPCGKTERK